MCWWELHHSCFVASIQSNPTQRKHRRVEVSLVVPTQPNPPIHPPVRATQPNPTQPNGTTMLRCVASRPNPTHPAACPPTRTIAPPTQSNPTIIQPQSKPNPTELYWYAVIGRWCVRVPIALLIAKSYIFNKKDVFRNCGSAAAYFTSCI